MSKEEKIKEVIEYLTEVKGEEETSKNLKDKLTQIMTLLQSEDHDGAIDKALHELDVAVDEISMQSYTRTRIWNAVSMLESI